MNPTDGVKNCVLDYNSLLLSKAFYSGMWQETDNFIEEQRLLCCLGQAIVLV